MVSHDVMPPCVLICTAPLRLGACGAEGAGGEATGESEAAGLDSGTLKQVQ